MHIIVAFTKQTRYFPTCFFTLHTALHVNIYSTLFDLSHNQNVSFLIFFYDFFPTLRFVKGKCIEGYLNSNSATYLAIIDTSIVTVGDVRTCAFFYIYSYTHVPLIKYKLYLSKYYTRITIYFFIYLVFYIIWSWSNILTYFCQK